MLPRKLLAARKHDREVTPAATRRAFTAAAAPSDGARPDAPMLPEALLVDPAAAPAERMHAALDGLLRGAHEPRMFEQRLYALARDAAVLDATGFARLALARLPAQAAALRAAGRRALARLHQAAAIECDKAGYTRPALGHLVRAALREPRILWRRPFLGIVVRRLRRNNASNRRLLQQAAAIFRLLEQGGLRACLFGSLAISLHAQRFVKQHGDIDLVFRSEAEVRRAADWLVDALACRIVRRYDWTGLTGERCFHIALRSPGGIPIELSYLPENPEVPVQTFLVDGVTLHAASLRGLRAIYALFLVAKAASSHDVEKQSKRNAILTIDRLLAGRAADGTRGGA